MKKKILMVSMPSIHFFRWTTQLKDSEFEVYWFDVTGGGTDNKNLDWVTQFTGWKNKLNYPGRIFIKSKFPRLYKWIQYFNEKNTNKEFEKILQLIKPDVVHSFAMYVSCTPIFKAMQHYSDLKWIYSSWGSDLYYFKNEKEYLADIKKILPRVNYLFTDCNRDFSIAKELGFKGEFLGVLPGGGGFDLKKLETYKIAFKEREIILIKGYEGRSGRAINVLKAILQLKEELLNFKIVVFGADPEVIEYSKKTALTLWSNFTIFGKIPREEVLKLMGTSLIYLGNSNSDGMPNTLLEAICLGCIPIQSNPGGVTEEVIEDNVNGFLIKDCESIIEIKTIIKRTILNINKNQLERVELNYLDSNVVKEQVFSRLKLIK